MNSEPINEDGEAIDGAFWSIVATESLFRSLSITVDDKLRELGIFNEDVYPYAIAAAVKLVATYTANSMGHKDTADEQWRIASDIFDAIEKSVENMKLNRGKQDE